MVDLGSAEVPYGMATFVKKSIKVRSRGVYEIFKLDEDVGLPVGMKNWDRLMQHVTVPYKDSNVTVFNLHGFYVGGSKGDTNVRITQSERVRAFMEQHPGEKILCGDFNLDPETKSFRMMGHGLRDLVKENGVTSTRSHHYEGGQRWADYILVSPEVHVEKFEVLQDVVSDHLPLLLEFN
jgi:endonuclease/exonuclease/phosphatase family metal-dependent hydrolase